LTENSTLLNDWDDGEDSGWNVDDNWENVGANSLVHH